MKQYGPEIPVSRHPAPDSVGCACGMGTTLNRVIGIITLATLIGGSLLGGVESWMLPESLWRTGDWVWLSVAGAGGLGFTGFMISLGCGRHRLRLAVVALGISLAMACGVRWIGGELALGRFFHSYELGGTADDEPESLSQRLAKWLEDKQLGVPAWLQARASANRAVADPPRMHRLLAASRWPVRRGFVKRMMRDEKLATYLVENWDECFPAVTGADVDLDHRRELMEWLRAFREDPSLSENSRHAATLWMGLVLLTDPAEFAVWREPVRDAMLRVAEPIQADHHDCWMRVLDTLLAFDPPESWPVATQVLASHPTTLRRAVRERVRGMMHHFDAIVREFDDSGRSGDWNGAFAIWQDTGRWLAAYPGSAGEHRVKQWRSTTMFRWLETDGLGTKWDKLFYNQEILLNLTDEDLVDLTPEQEAVLYAKACGWADQAAALSEIVKDPSGRDERAAHAALERVRVLHPFLGSALQKDLVRRLAPALTRPAVYTASINANSKPHAVFATCNRCRRFLERSWHLISPEHLKILAGNIRPLISPRGSGAWLLCFDAWSDTPEFSDDEWLLHALSFERIWRVMPRGTPGELLEIVPNTNLPVPPASDETVRKVIADLKAAMFDGNGSMLSLDTIQSNLARLYPDHPPTLAVTRALCLRIRVIQRNFRPPESPDFETLVRIELFLSGLTEADDSLLAVVASQGRDNDWFYRSLPEWRLDDPDPWSEVLKSVSAARRSVQTLVGRDYGDRLQGLLSSAAKSPPAGDVVGAMWQELLKLAETSKPDLKPQIYGALIHLSPLVSANARLAMRQDFLEYFRKTPLPIDKWPDKAIHDIRQARYFRPKGEGIPWENDALSAALSWSSDIGRQIDFTPEYGFAEKFTGVFSYLAQAMVSYADEGLGGIWLNHNPVHEPLPRTVWKRQPLHLPFEPTPWQQARDLHLRCPDLRFPDRAWVRPGRSRS
jgi:hypothetical protein